jgi:hypothetical protein
MDVQCPKPRKETDMRSNSEVTNQGGIEERELDGLGNRSITRILERSRARRNRRSYTRAPDFVHGDCRVDAPYETFGTRWVETTGFVERLTDADGAVVGWTVGTYQEGFLSLEHAAVAETDDMEAWLADRLEDCSRMVALELNLDSDPESWAIAGIDEVMPVESIQQRLHELEEEHLQVTRDRDFGGRYATSVSLDERFLQSRLNVMSLVCLCAQLAG